MTNAKKPEKAAAKIEVRMLCILSGGSKNWNPGDTLEVDAAEAERLVGLGAAELA